MAILTSITHSVQPMNRLARLRQAHVMLGSYNGCIQQSHQAAWDTALACSRLDMAFKAPVSRCISVHSSLDGFPAITTPNTKPFTGRRYYKSSSFHLGSNRSQDQDLAGSNDILTLTQRLLSNSIENQSSSGLHESSIEFARGNESFLKSLGLSSSDAQSMFLLPPGLLKDVHLAISHFSKRENSQGFVLDRPAADEGAIRHNKIPGPIICARLLELIGVPYYYSNIAAKSRSSPILLVHSSQIDDILHCCLQTTLALSNSCNTGNGSLIGYDFNFRGDWQHGGQKTAAHLAEEIWRSVWNMQIKFTFEKKGNRPVQSEVRMPNLLTRISAMNNNALSEYLNSDESKIKMPSISWSKKDQRRYKQSITLFNSTLAAYARLGSSSSGIQHEVRRDMVQAAERLLLELAATNNAIKPSSSTIIQCTRPNVISFNTAINAWSQLSPRHKGATRDEQAASMAILTAERTQAILEMMQELWDEERSSLSTRQSIQAAWGEYGDGESYQAHDVAPNTSTYNTVLNAWSRSLSDDSTDKAMKVFKTMIDRCNLRCNGRVSLMRKNSKQQQIAPASLNGDHAFPDSRTFVALLGSCSNMRSKPFRDAINFVEMIYDTMKYWDEQLKWSTKHKISPDGISMSQHEANILNVFAYNALIKVFSTIPKSSWNESLQCCNRIDEIISKHMAVTTPDVITRGIAINAWAKCADFANDQAQKDLCVAKACAHLDLMISDSMTSQCLDGDKYSKGYNISRSHALHSFITIIALCAKTSMPTKANELFLRAKDCKLHNLTTITTVVDALTRSKDISHTEKALYHILDLEREMAQKNAANITTKRHDFTWMYNACIAGFINAEQNNGDGRDKAHNMLLHMIERYSDNPLHIGRPNTTSFAIVMDALAQNGQSDKVKSLLTIMERLNQLRKDCHSSQNVLEANVGPNIIHYNTLMTAYVRSNNSRAAEFAQELFNQMKNDPSLPSPDAVTNHLIHQLQNKSCQGKDFDVCDSVTTGDPLNFIGINRSNEKLDNLIHDTIRQSHNPSAKSFNSMMKSFAGTVEGAIKATALLHRIDEMHAAGDIEISPDVVLYNLVLNSWQICEQKNDTIDSTSPSEKADEILETLCTRHKTDTNLSPNDASFSICIHSWCKSRRPDAAKRAERILRKKEEFLNQHVDGIAIRTADYNPIISKWKEDPEHGLMYATNLFEEMTQKSNKFQAYEPPNENTLNSLLAVYAKSSDVKGAEKAEECLRQANDMYEKHQTKLRPGMISYRTCINAYIGRKSSDSPPKVEALVEDMIEKYEVQGRADLRPDSNILDLILKACNLVPMTWNMNGKDKANAQIIEIANRTFTKLRGKNNLKTNPTHSTYAYMFRIYNRHMDFTDPRYDLLMRNLWTQCCKDGLVSEFTLESFRMSVKERTFFECIGRRGGMRNAESVTVSSLCHDWRKNVVPKRAQTNEP